MPKIDPIRIEYYKPLKTSQTISNMFFWVSTILSLLIIIINKNNYPYIIEILKIFFILSVIILGINKIITQFYLSPRAQEHRYKDFLSHAFSIPHYEQTAEYYNNNETETMHRIAAQTLENSFYSKNTIQNMLKHERLKIIIYSLTWLILILNRNSGLDFIIIITQIVFSEIILFHWITMEWLKYKFNKVFDDAFNLFNTVSDENSFNFVALEITGVYEMAKANSGIPLSEKIFLKNAKQLDEEWIKIKTKLKI